MTEQTILIVEDDPDIRDGVRILLAGEGYRILEAENGAKALQTFSPEVDLVILDVMMPGMSGLRVCEELRKKSTVPILFLTAKAQESDKLVGLTAGGDDYLAKPFSFAELSARVRALLAAEPARSQKITSMRLEGYSFYEIGLACGVSEASARVIDFRAKKRIRAALEQEGYYER